MLSGRDRCRPPCSNIGLCKYPCTQVSCSWCRGELRHLLLIPSSDLNGNSTILCCEAFGGNPSLLNTGVHARQQTSRVQLAEDPQATVARVGPKLTILLRDFHHWDGIDWNLIFKQLLVGMLNVSATAEALADWVVGEMYMSWGDTNNIMITISFLPTLFLEDIQGRPMPALKKCFIV